MMTNDVIQAIQLLQEKAMRVSDSYTLDRIERALDELCEHSDRTGAPKKLANAALGNAGKVLRNREKRLVRNDEKDLSEVLDSSKLCKNALDIKHLEFEFLDTLGRSNLKPHDVGILLNLSIGLDADDIAQKQDVTVERARVWVTRARNRFKKAWGQAQ